MALSIEFHADLHRVTIRWVGPLNDIDYLKVDEELRAHPDFDPTLDQIIDARGASVNEVTRAGILQLTSRPPAFAASSRRAIVAPGDLAFGLARMFEQMRGDEAGVIRIFREVHEAESWLDAERGRNGP